MKLYQVIAEFEAEYCYSLAETTRLDYSSAIRTHILPALGLLDYQAITQKQVIAIHANMVDTPYRANLVLAVLSKVYTWKLGKTGHNPCRGIRRYKNLGREVYLQREELFRLAEALGRIEDRYFVAAILLYLSTGCRKREILNCKWSYINFGSATMVLPKIKTGKLAVPLSPFSVHVLKSIYSPSNVYVIPGHSRNGKTLDTTKPRQNINDHWLRLRDSLGITARIHDLRHTFASIVANEGGSIYSLQKLLGHLRIETTMRYAHLFDKTLRDTSDKASNYLLPMLQKPR
jgi:integrase